LINDLIGTKLFSERAQVNIRLLIGTLIRIGHMHARSGQNLSE